MDEKKSSVFRKVNAIRPDGALSQRCTEICCEKNAEGTVITAWQCNMADVQHFDVKLPTAIILKTGADGKVISAELLENFKGSQGIPCSRRYLDRKLKQQLIGKSIRPEDRELQDPLMFACRHLYELVIGASWLYFEMCRRDETSCCFTEKSRAFELENGLKITDISECFGTKVRSRVLLEFPKNKVKMNEAGEVDYLEDLVMRCRIEREGENSEESCFELAKAVSAEDVVMQVMKLFSRFWHILGKQFDTRRSFYFSNMWPPTLYGIFVQSVSLVLFQNNYAYFQHAIHGIQRGRKAPQCVGIVSNMQEAQEYFPDLEAEDLYEE